MPIRSSSNPAKAKRLPKTSDGMKPLAIDNKKTDDIEKLAIEDKKHDTKDAPNNEIDQGPTEDMDIKSSRTRSSAMTRERQMTQAAVPRTRLRPAFRKRV